MPTKNWSFASIWNNSLESFDERKLEPRNYIYASELGGSFVDRYLKMKAKPMTNPPNPRSRRKFQAGNIWEWIIRFVLIRAGIMRSSQERVYTDLPGLLRVSGRLDFIAGGKLNYEQALSDIKALELPEYIDYVTEQLIKNLRATYGDKELVTCIAEAKSVSTFVFDRNERINKPNPNHVLQSFHYMIGKPMEHGKIIYVCKDDCRLLEFNLTNPDPETYLLYKSDVETMTGYYDSGTQPPPEQELIFDPASFRFNTNWKVEYSAYLTMLYGYKDPEHYRETWKKAVGQYNRVFKRIVTGENMTKANIEIIKEAKMYFSDWDKMVYDAKQSGVFETDDEETEE